MATYHTRNLIVIIFCSFLVSSVQGSRGVLRTDGIVQVRGERGAVPRVTVMPFDSPAYVLPEGSARFVLELELDNTFLVTFEHAGCVTKQLYFDTRVSIEKHAAEFTFPFRVILEMHDGAQAFTYAGPVGFIRYHHEITDFAYETDYTATVDPSFAIRAVEMQRTGSDPLVIGNVPLAARVVTSKYHRPNQEAPERVETDAMGTLAPMVAEVPRMVHRTGRPEEAAVMVVLVPGTTELEVLVAPFSVPRILDPVAVIAVLPASAHLAKLVEHVVADPEIAVVVLVVPLPVDAPLILSAPSTAPLLVARVAYVITPSASTGREEELVVDANRVTTIIRILFQDGRSTEYRRVSSRWGDVYFFKDGLNIPEVMYEAGVAL